MGLNLYDICTTDDTDPADTTVDQYSAERGAPGKGGGHGMRIEANFILQVSRKRSVFFSGRGDPVFLMDATFIQHHSKLILWILRTLQVYCGYYGHYMCTTDTTFILWTRQILRYYNSTTDDMDTTNYTTVKLRILRAVRSLRFTLHLYYGYYGYYGYYANYNYTTDTTYAEFIRHVNDGNYGCYRLYYIHPLATTEYYGCCRLYYIYHTSTTETAYTTIILRLLRALGTLLLTSTPQSAGPPEEGDPAGST